MNRTPARVSFLMPNMAGFIWLNLIEPNHKECGTMKKLLSVLLTLVLLLTAAMPFTGALDS